MALDSAAMIKSHTYQEIHSQPQLWLQLNGNINGEILSIRAWLKTLSINEIWLTGAGTSAFVGDIIADELNTQLPLTVRSISSTDLVSAPHLFFNANSSALVVSFGRSGSSSETLGVLNLLDKLSPASPRLNITCNESSELATRSSAAEQRTLVLPAHDRGFAMKTLSVWYAASRTTSEPVIHPVVLLHWAVEGLSSQHANRH